MTARSKAYTRIGCLPDCWSDRTLRPVRRSEAPIGCTGGVRVLSAGLRPGDFELLAAPPAGHAARPSRQRLPLPAARANGVALAPARGETHGVVGPGDHAPRRSFTFKSACKRAHIPAIAAPWSSIAHHCFA